MILQARPITALPAPVGEVPTDWPVPDPRGIYTRNSIVELLPHPLSPLFALASAVVTDVGGPLSHGSIVAREYEIPAVMGTGVATQRIVSGQMVQVDGNAGTVTLLDGDGTLPAAACRWSDRRLAAALLVSAAALLIWRRRR